jgi:hypothetical protein
LSGIDHKGKTKSNLVDKDQCEDVVLFVAEDKSPMGRAKKLGDDKYSRPGRYYAI